MLVFFFFFFHLIGSLLTSQVALVIKNSPVSAGDIRDMSLIPGSERSPAGSHGNTLQHSCLENMNRGAWPATVQGVASVMPDYL